jgi:hypothetical protein
MSVGGHFTCSRQVRRPQHSSIFPGLECSRVRAGNQYSLHEKLQFVHLYILVSGSSAALVCLSTQYASLLSHFEHFMAIFGNVSDLPSTISSSLSAFISERTVFLVDLVIFSSLPHLRHLNLPFSGNISDLHFEQNIL